MDNWATKSRFRVSAYKFIGVVSLAFGITADYESGEYYISANLIIGNVSVGWMGV